jgi:hypothetical protein
LRELGAITDEDRRRLVAALLAADRFAEAYEIWLGGREDRSDGERSGNLTVTDGSFEGTINLSETGFGWRVARNTGRASVSLDTKEPHDGLQSLRLDFKGEFPFQAPLVSQLVPVKAKTWYRLSFAARTCELVTTALPMVVLIDASTGQALAPRLFCHRIVAIGRITVLNLWLMQRVQQ